MDKSDIARQYHSTDAIHRNNVDRNWANIRTDILLSDFRYSHCESVNPEANKDLVKIGLAWPDNPYLSRDYSCFTGRGYRPSPPDEKEEMKKKKILKSIENIVETLHEKEAEEGVVGYALFDTVKRAFVTFGYTDYATYTGNIEDAYVADSRGEAFYTMMNQVDNYLDTKIVPLISNDLFGLTPLPGSLEN
ncbi:hypothetical protein ACQFN5_30080 (plasmid) [Klebsiella sp. WOUb02]|uniref:hypothetical protein n=1 Tax=Klebsiella sp. WOUb02 TaxID=3161071 RepID=UPI003CEEF6E4